MALSIRRQALRIRKRRISAEERCKRKQNAIHMLRKYPRIPVRTVAEHTELGKSTIHELKRLLDTKDVAAVELQTNEQVKSKVGRPPVLTEDEEALIVERINEAAERGFAVDNDTLKYVMASVASDGRSGWKTGIPSNDAVRSFRGRHSHEICFRKFYPKDNAKLKGESYEHVKTFFDVVQKLGHQHDGLLQDPDRIWNMDETAVDATWGKAKKAYGPKKSKHGGCRVQQKTNGINKHVTAVIVCSASGLKAPPFYIVARKSPMSGWVAPLSKPYHESPEVCQKYCKPDWLPEGSVIKCTENGSMDRATLHAFMKHVNKFVRKHLPETVPYLLTLDGHASRKGIEWVEECEEHNCLPVIKPANTSHFLQPCDRRINKAFKQSMRYLRDEFHKALIPDTRTPQFNLVCAAYAHGSITVAHIKHSFADTGVFPFDSSFANRFKKKEPDESLLDVKLPDTVAFGLAAVRKRRTDDTVVEKALLILQDKSSSSIKVKHLSNLMKNATTAYSIITGAIKPVKTVKELEANNGSTAQHPSVPLDCGAPAEHKTVAQMLQEKDVKRKEKKVKEQKDKELRAAREKQKAKKLQERKEQAMRKVEERMNERKKKQRKSLLGKVAKGCVRKQLQFVKRKRRQMKVNRRTVYDVAVGIAGELVSEVVCDALGL